jgi:hypothetical protein
LKTGARQDLAYARLALALGWASLALFQLRAFLGPVSTRLCFVPDDGFYYLMPAWNFAKLHLWSFDGGATLTSGFHLLWAWVLAGAACLAGSREALLLAGLILGSLLTHACVALAAKAFWRNPCGLLVLAVLAGSWHAAMQSLSLMEWPLLILCSGAYAWALWAGRGGPLLFGLGLLGSLARSDFGLWPACLLAASWLMARGERRLQWGALWGLLGACCGVLLLFAHNLAFTGSLLQGSARMKLFAGSVRGPNALMSLRTLLHLWGGRYLAFRAEGGFSQATKAAALALGALGVAALLAAFWPRLKELPRRAKAFFLASLLALAGYHFLYCFDAAVQLWYTANQAVPSALLLGIAFWSASGKLRSWIRAALAFLLLWNLGLTQLRFQPPYPENLLAAQAGSILKERRGTLKDGRIGSWNSGVLNFYQGGGVTNLDGLMNNEVLPHLKAGSTACYIQSKGIAYLCDRDVFNPRDALGFGTSDGLLQSAVLAKEPLAQSPEGGDAYYLYSLDLKKLKAACPPSKEVKR